MVRDTRRRPHPKSSFTPTPAAATARKPGASSIPELEQIVHLYLLNRGVLITPFHNMILVCPDTSVDDVDRLVSMFDACLAELTTGASLDRG